MNYKNFYFILGILISVPSNLLGSQAEKKGLLAIFLGHKSKDGSEISGTSKPENRPTRALSEGARNEVPADNKLHWPFSKAPSESSIVVKSPSNDTPPHTPPHSPAPGNLSPDYLSHASMLPNLLRTSTRESSSSRSTGSHSSRSQRVTVASSSTESSPNPLWAFFHKSSSDGSGTPSPASSPIGGSQRANSTRKMPNGGLRKAQSAGSLPTHNRIPSALPFIREMISAQQALSWVR